MHGLALERWDIGRAGGAECSVLQPGEFVCRVEVRKSYTATAAALVAGAAE
jgi:hypothetical protein